MSNFDKWIIDSTDLVKPFCTSLEIDGIKTRLNSACEKEFSRGISELIIARYYADNHPKEIYLPRGNRKDKDIDVSYIASGQRINIEVKCPDLTHDQSKTFTLQVPYTHSDFKEGKKTERELAKTMGNDLNVVPNKVLNFNDFLIDCEAKFKESAEGGDLNIVLFSMLELEWMDDYRIKIEEEGLLAEFDSVHAVVLSNAAFFHKRGNNNSSGFENCFNYIIPNWKSSPSLTTEKFDLALSSIPNMTHEANAWYKELVRDDDEIGIIVKGIQRLKLFYKIALSTGELITSDIVK